MIAELRTKSQITIPKDIVAALHLACGDKLEIFEKDGMVCMMPVAVYPKAYVEGLESELAQVKSRLRAGKQPVFDHVDDMFASLEES